jgi:acetyl esterase/lipase
MRTVADYLALPAAPADRRLAYGPHPDQFADLYLPAGPGPHPVVLLIHGGCWQATYGLAPMGALCAALRGLGLAVYSLEYRRLGGGGGWPATFQDVAAGADALRELAAAHRLDLGSVIAAGHSAGGHLALWLAARPGLPAASELFRPSPLALRGVLALAAVADLAEGVARGLCGGACADLLGGPPARWPARYAQASPAAMPPPGVPQHHLGGEDDPIVPADYLRSYVAAAGGQASLELLPRAGHFELVDPASAAWPPLRRAALALLGLPPA